MLVQNHRQQLNGNNLPFVGLILCLLFLFTACKTQKKVTSSTNRSTQKPKTNQPKSQATKTVRERQWKFADKEKSAPIGAKKVVKNDKQANYNIAVLIPFNTSGANSTNLVQSGSAENRFMNYYLGMKMALESNRYASSMAVNVYDCENKSIQSLLNEPGVRNADVIIGPYDKSDIKQTGYFAEENEIVLISPWQASKKIAQKNPYYVQMKPNLDDHYTSISNDILKSYNPEQVYLIGRDNGVDTERFKYFQATAKSKSGNRFNEYIVSEDSLKYGETAFDSTFFQQNDPAVFIIPNWKSEDENFVYSCMRKLRVEKELSKVVVYGMPIVAESDKITYDLYNNLNTHVAISSFYNKEDNQIKQFRRSFYNAYNAIPSKDAAQGYDLGNYVCNNLSKHGKTFQYFLANDNDQYLLSKFNVDRYLLNSEGDMNDPKNINYFLNNAVQIIHFNRGQFRIK